MVQKASTPWSARTVAEGGTDSPVGDLVPVPDSAQPIINAGFIDQSGKWRLDRVATDARFTRFGPETLAQNAAMHSPTINLVDYEICILAINSDGGHTVIIEFQQPADAIGAYVGMDDLGGMGADDKFKSADSETDGLFIPIGDDSAETVADTWKFWRINNVKGTTARFKIANNDSSTHSIHAAFLRVA